MKSGRNQKEHEVGMVCLRVIAISQSAQVIQQEKASVATMKYDTHPMSGLRNRSKKSATNKTITP